MRVVKEPYSQREKLDDGQLIKESFIAVPLLILLFFWPEPARKRFGPNWGVSTIRFTRFPLMGTRYR